MTEVRVRNSREIAVILGLVDPPKTHSIEAIKAGVQKFYKEHGKPPKDRSGDATSYVGYKATWGAVGQWLWKNGYNFSHLLRELGLETYHAEHDFKAIKKGIRRYHQEHGKPPAVNRRQAEPYIGYKATWGAVDQWLKSNGHGSLSQFCQEMGLSTYYAPHNTKAIRKGIRRFYEEHGKSPTENSGDASEYLGYKATWGAVDSWLRSNGHRSLPQLCKKVGLSTHYAPHNTKAIRKGIRRFYEEHGKAPAQAGGPAISYVGYKTTWVAVDGWLRGNGHGSLSQLCEELGLDAHYASHSLKAIKAGIQKYHKKHERTPTSNSGEATLYVGYKTTWAAVGGWLRKNEQTSISQTCKGMGLGARRAVHDLNSIKKGIRKYHRKHERTPTSNSGEATLYVGYKTTWMAVNHWLTNNGHGSLSQLRKKMGLK